MASTEAQKAKDRGNTAFKRGDYPEAIGHYSAAIVADRTDATFPLNRAAAYLKLGKHEDAERDCTTVLRLKPGNVKALYRRAQARSELGKLSEAQEDLQLALKHEPNNESVKTELAKVSELLVKSKTKAPKQPKTVSSKPSPIKSVDAPVPRKRRRVPITPIENQFPPDESPIQPPTSDEPLKAVSTRRLTPSTSANATPTVITAPGTPHSQENDPNTERTQPSVRGGIFRPSGSHTLYNQDDSIDPKTELNTRSAGTSKSNTNSGIRVPLLRQSVLPTLFDFMQVWNSTEDPVDKWRLFSQISPPQLPIFFKANLEASFLASLLEVFSHLLKSASATENDDGAIAEQIREYMSWLTKVQRFVIVSMFLSKQERGIARDVLERVGNVEGWSL